MNVLFIEYNVKENVEQAYVKRIKQALLQYENVDWLESREQRRLYLEVWEFDSLEKLVQFSDERSKQPDSRWRTLDDFINGGVEKLNVWSFKVPE